MRSSVQSESCLPLVILLGEAVFWVKGVYLWSHCLEKQCSSESCLPLAKLLVDLHLIWLTWQLPATYYFPPGRLEMSDVFNLSGIQGCHLIWSPFLSTPLFFYLFLLLVLLVPFVLIVRSFFLFSTKIVQYILWREAFLGILLSSRMAACDHMAFVFAVIFYFTFYHFWPKNKTTLFFHPVFKNKKSRMVEDTSML